MILLNRWWGVLAAGMVGAVVGAWVGLGVKWIADVGEVAISRGAAVGGLVGLYFAILMALRRPPFRERRILVGHAVGLSFLSVPGLLPVIQMVFDPYSLVMVLVSVVVSSALTGLMACMWLGFATTMAPDAPRSFASAGAPYDHEADEHCGPATPVSLYDQERDRVITPRGVGAYERQQAREFLAARARAGEDGYRDGSGALSLGALG